MLQAGGSRTILVVDDEDFVRDTLRIHLERAGYRVVTADDGEDAIEALKAHDISLIITDIKMPGIDGFGVLSYVEQNYSFLPVVMLTGYVDVEVGVAAMTRGACDYVAKPVGKKELIATVERALGEVESAREKESFQLSGVYLLTDGGKLIHHKAVASRSESDSDIFGSMLTAVRMFIEDSFHKPNREVKSFEYGDSKILMEEGEGFFLVAVGEGEDTGSMRREMRRTVRRIENRYGDSILKWSGSVDELGDIEGEFGDLIEECRDDELQ